MLQHVLWHTSPGKSTWLPGGLRGRNLLWCSADGRRAANCGGCLKWAPFPSDCANVLFHKCFLQIGPILRSWLMSSLLSGPNSSCVSCQAIDNFETRPTNGGRAGSLAPRKRTWSWRSGWSLALSGLLGMAAFVATSSEYHQSRHRSFLHFKGWQGGRKRKLCPKNLNKISLCSDKN